MISLILIWLIGTLAIFIVSCCICRDRMPESLIVSFLWCVVLWPFFVVAAIGDLFDYVKKDLTGK